MENVSRRMMDFDKKESKDSREQNLFKPPSSSSNEHNLSNEKESKDLSNKNVETQDKLCEERLEEDKNVVNMDSVVSDLNSFLASTRRAMSSPASQKRNGSLNSSTGTE